MNIQSSVIEEQPFEETKNSISQNDISKDKGLVKQKSLILQKPGKNGEVFEIKEVPHPNQADEDDGENIDPFHGQDEAEQKAI